MHPTAWKSTIASLALALLAAPLTAQHHPRPAPNARDGGQAEPQATDQPLVGPRVDREGSSRRTDDRRARRERPGHPPADLVAERVLHLLGSSRADESVRLSDEQRRAISQALDAARKQQAAYYQEHRATIVEILREGQMDGLADRLARDGQPHEAQAREGQSGDRAGERLARIVPRLVAAGMRPVPPAGPRAAPRAGNDGEAEGRDPAPRPHARPGTPQPPRREAAPGGGRFDPQAAERQRLERLPAIRKLAQIARDAPGQEDVRQILAETLTEPQRTWLRERLRDTRRERDAAASGRGEGESPRLRIPPQQRQRTIRRNQGEQRPAPTMDEVDVPAPAGGG